MTSSQRNNPFQSPPEQKGVTVIVADTKQPSKLSSVIGLGFCSSVIMASIRPFPVNYLLAAFSIDNPLAGFTIGNSLVLFAICFGVAGCFLATFAAIAFCNGSEPLPRRAAAACVAFGCGMLLLEFVGTLVIAFSRWL